jgi:hypothetical protein
MKYYTLLLIVIMVFALFLAGCTQLSGTSHVTPVVTATTIPTPKPTTPVPTDPETTVPRQVVTIIHQVSLVKDMKDSELLFTLQVPAEWSVSTHRLVNPDDSEGLVYQTDIVGDNVFYIQTYAISRSQDQAYRDQFRKWSPTPTTETTVTINKITYDRFESTSGGKTNVAYVAKKSSANERGYASVLVFSADNNNRFEKDDFEKIVASFRYFGAGSASAIPGEEIPRTNV